MISFTIYGHPQPQGSIRAFTPKGWKRPVLTSDNAKLKPWRQQISGTAYAIMKNHCFPCLDKNTAVCLRMVFYFAQPASAKRRFFPTVKPDADKLVRSILDSLTGIVFTDDSQVTDLVVAKRYGLPERAEIAVTVQENLFSTEPIEEKAAGA